MLVSWTGMISPPPEEELVFEAEDVEVAKAVENLVTQAVDNGFDASYAEALRALVQEYPDMFRLHIGKDPPADVEPLEVQMIPGAQSFRCKMRKYPE